MSSSDIIPYLIIVKTEWYRQRMLQQRQNTSEKLLKVGFPCPIGIYAICPTYLKVVTQMLTIVWEKLLAALWVCNTVSLAKHQHASNSESFR